MLVLRKRTGDSNHLVIKFITIFSPSFNLYFVGNHNDYVGALCGETACDKMFTNLDTPGYTSFSRIGFLPFQWIEIFFGLLSLIESGCFSRWNSYKLWPKIVEPINNDDHVLCPAFIIFLGYKNYNHF